MQVFILRIGVRVRLPHGQKSNLVEFSFMFMFYDIFILCIFPLPRSKPKRGNLERRTRPLTMIWSMKTPLLVSPTTHQKRER